MPSSSCNGNESLKASCVWYIIYIIADNESAKGKLHNFEIKMESKIVKVIELKHCQWIGIIERILHFILQWNK